MQLAASHGLEPDQAGKTVIRATCQAVDANRLERALSSHAPDGVASLSAAAQADVAVAYALSGKFKAAKRRCA